MATKEKAKIDNYEDAKNALVDAKAARKEANSNMKSFLMKNKLKLNGDHSKDKKHGAKFTELQAAVDKSRAAVEKAEAKAKELKPATERASKYEYPEDCKTAADKKRYRAAQRAAKKKADKPEKAEKSEKKSKKSDKAEAAPEKSKKSGKKSKKNKKGKKAQSED